MSSGYALYHIFGVIVLTMVVICLTYEVNKSKGIKFNVKPHQFIILYLIVIVICSSFYLRYVYKTEKEIKKVWDVTPPKLTIGSIKN